MKKKTGFLVLLSCMSCFFFEKKKERGLSQPPIRTLQRRWMLARPSHQQLSCLFRRFLFLCLLENLKAVKKAEYLMMTMMLVSRITESRSAVCS
ncbi:unnamed protein product [Sphagnum jensenii]|uniref:Secreted protein n=1 Tax=Sphagnum jensenii TaxID=128206 RepID=A0ABP0XAF8_9BRYO